MVLTPDGDKEYLPVDDYDRALYRNASTELRASDFAYPQVAIEPGYNTDQVLNYNYTQWHQMFNDRQLLCLSILSERIRRIEKESLRALFACLLSGCLEFNSMFCSFKGEGTGAVRHVFSHHILKPERTPLEANLWGTPESSGSFSTLFERRILRALEYKENPFELRLSDRVNGRRQSKKVFGINRKMGGEIASTYDDFQKNGFDIYLSCGSSSQTDIEDGVVDAVITDPPFFDNVHYSQLADFFHVWIREMIGHQGIFRAETTRSTEEVQQTDPRRFTDNLITVFRDCHRVLKDEGLLIFTYHHSRPEGWSAILEAIHEAGFYIETTHPVKSEMSVSIPKQQAKSPIDIDIIVVGRKLALIEPFLEIPSDLFEECIEETCEVVEAFNGSNRKLSRSDITVITMSRLITTLSRIRDLEEILSYLDSVERKMTAVVERIWEQQNPRAVFEERQMRLFQEAVKETTAKDEKPFSPKFCMRPMDIEEIKAKVRADQYVYTDHAEIERKADELTFAQVEEALLDGEILEQYPDTGRGESCLVIGFVKDVPIHVVCGWHGERVALITVYIPRPPKFIDPWTRGGRTDEES